jgi:hypothetical protein
MTIYQFEVPVFRRKTGTSKTYTVYEFVFSQQFQNIYNLLIYKSILNLDASRRYRHSQTEFGNEESRKLSSVVSETMRKAAFPVDVPVNIGIGENWERAH